MVATIAIKEKNEMLGFTKKFLSILFYPIIFVFRLLFRRNNEEVEEDENPSAESSRSETAVTPSIPKEPQEVWSVGRLEICERLWGEGCLNPFNSEFMIGRLRLLDMDESNSLLQLGAGLGGTTRSMAEQIGIWVTGYETDENLLEIAKMRNQMAGMSKKAAISRFRPDAPKFKANGFNAALANESLTLIENKDVIIQSVAKSLRSNGHFIMVDYVLPSGDPPNPNVMNWYNKEPEKPKLWTARRTYDTIKDAGLDVRVAEDFTSEYRSMVLNGWIKLLSGLTKKELTPDFAAVLIKECEFWIYRISALDSGGLKVYRYHAIKE